FGPNSAVMLHLISLYAPDVPVVWVDHGYNLRDTYIVAEEIMQRLSLNMKIYSPLITTERLNVLMDGIPLVDTPEHDQFTQRVKLEPFDRAINEISPSIWLTGIRAEDTAHRKDVGQVSYDGRGLLRVSPIFSWTDDDITNYMSQHDLPSCTDYFDPTKAEEGRECGLHTIE
ncbi:MAG: phosphoadenosine phosphosulfate reductase family protein, partial [Pseudomonadota bacterium]